MKGSPR
jgi:hypothetical protein